MKLYPVSKMIMVSIVLVLSTLASTGILQAAQSTITEAEGYACMGDDKSRKQTEQQAMADVKRNAADKVLTYIKSETRVKDSMLEKDIIDAYANASIHVVEEIEKGWYKDASTGDCYRIKIKADVTPDEKTMKRITKEKGITDDPSAPLNVQVWTGQKDYKQGEKIKIYIKGNKPFYARLLYKDAGGNMVQLLPNPFRTENYFNGGVIYELPSGNDRFDLEVSPPFGSEDIILYTSTAQLGDLRLEAQGDVYQVKTKAQDIGINTRGVKVSQAGDNKTKAAAEFFEEKAAVHTTGR